MTDTELMLAFQRGRRDAFEKLVLRHQVGVFNFFMRMLHDRELAEDQTQEVFLRLYLGASRYRVSAKFTTYLYRIARNCWIDHLRRMQRRGRNISLDRENPEGKNLYERLDAHSDGPTQGLETQERARIVEQALASLPEKQRMVFVLSEIQGMQYAEIAATLEIPVGTVKSRMHTAVTRLRDFLARHGIVTVA